MPLKNDAASVAVGKPKGSGAVFVAPLGTALPIDASKPLDSKYACLGYVSEDGVTNTVETETEDIKAWGGETVRTVRTSRKETFTMSFIESNMDVLKLVYGTANVSGTSMDALTVKHTNAENERLQFVIEVVLTDQRIKRMVIPVGQVTEVGEISYKDDEAIAYECTISTFPDTSGTNVYEYYAKAGSTAPAA